MPLPHVDWEALRTSSLAPDGFSTKRVEIWSRLMRPRARLNSPSTCATEDAVDDIATIEELKDHPDERQMVLDTQRSFVMYPFADEQYSSGQREVLQEQLHDLLVSVFRRHPKLRYFQGYHDIVTVIFLTLPPELRRDCVAQLSLQRLRDSMGTSLEPVLGLLRIMKGLLRVTDPSYASTLENHSRLPYYALSNLLTLFSHDMPTISLIQHVFDYLLCRPPIHLVYLATAIILSRKEEVLQLVAEGEEDMIHSLLSGVPALHDTEEFPDSAKQELAADGVDDNLCQDSGDIPPTSHLGGNPNLRSSRAVMSVGFDPIQDANIFGQQDVVPKTENLDIASALLCDEQTLTQSSPLISRQEGASTISFGDVQDAGKAQRPEPPPTDAERLPPQRPPVSLLSLLRLADDLYAASPPTHPDINAASIMGPQSVIFTWSEDSAALPSDAEAEAMVEQPHLVVYPPPPVEVAGADGDAARAVVERKEGARRRRLRALQRRLRSRPVDRGMVLAGAAAILGVAIALFGMRKDSHIANGHCRWLIEVCGKIMRGIAHW